MARVNSAGWLARLRAKGWTRDQIQQATGASPSTQRRIANGQKSSKYDTAIREAGGKYSRRSTPPAEFPHRPKHRIGGGNSIGAIISQLSDAGLDPGDDYDILVETFGRAGAASILRGQLAAHRRFKRDGICTRRPGDPDSWFWTQGEAMMRRFNDDTLFDARQYIGQLWYVGGPTR